MESHLRVVSDAAFKRELEDGFSLRGVCYLRCETLNFAATDVRCHVLDWVCKSQRHVTRSTFVAELLGAGDALDQGINIAQLLYEVVFGVATAEKARAMYDFGSFLMALYVDAKSVFAAVTATFLKVSAEKSLLSHVQYIREKLDDKVLPSLFWIDTRDMHADGLAKGNVDRALLHEVMDSTMKLRHDFDHWETKIIWKP